VEVGDTPSGSADLSVSSGSLNGQLTLNGNPVGTLIIQPPLVIIVPGEGWGGAASCRRQITITRNGTPIYQSNITRTATGVVGSRAYTVNGPIRVWNTATPPPGEDVPEWVQLTFTNLVYQVDLVGSGGVSFLSGTVKVDAGDSPAVTATMSVSQGSLRGSLQVDETVYEIRAVKTGGVFLIVIVPA